jgi:S1-C subfamily serine protease
MLGQGRDEGSCRNLMDPARAIAGVRDSICAIMRIHEETRAPRKAEGKGQPSSSQFGVSFAGTGWCIFADRYVVTAHHVLNDMKARLPKDKFVVFTVPGNGDKAYHFPVKGFVVEDASSDLAILELGPAATPGQHIPAVPVTFARPPDGSRVVTFGFPAPVIQKVSLDRNGDYVAGGSNFLLKGHANEGIVAAQYDFGPDWAFEFNVAWHHGESGGPIFLQQPLAAFAVMQLYRNVKSPHGVVAGPHVGRSLAAIQGQLASCGATVV